MSLLYLFFVECMSLLTNLCLIHSMSLSFVFILCFYMSPLYASFESMSLLTNLCLFYRFHSYVSFICFYCMFLLYVSFIRVFLVECISNLTKVSPFWRIHDSFDESMPFLTNLWLLWQMYIAFDVSFIGLMQISFL